ncbi:MAG: epoxide hydrolase family protein [Steroidobacteraceae bacterium]
MGDVRSTLAVERFSIQVEDSVLLDLRRRIANTRWPEPAPGAPWELGTDNAWLRGLLEYWEHSFDWPAQQRLLNSFAQFRADIDGVRIHFVHEKARVGTGIPLILTHGWPSAFLEYLPLVPLLTDPGAHGLPGPAFDLVIPSLPGYGFSDRPRRTGLNYNVVAGLWHQLMSGLGYERYAVGGGDFGAGVATFMALRSPSSVIGIHLSNLELVPYIGSGSRPLSVAEHEYLKVSSRWWETEGGYKSIQSSKPQSLAFGLTDSPAGLAAWIAEKWRDWSDCEGNPLRHISADFLLTLLTIYWATGTIATSMRDYYDNRWHAVAIRPEDFVNVPTGVASFTRQYKFEGAPPREWAERLYNVVHWRSMPRGGHFAPCEEPILLAGGILEFFSQVLVTRGAVGSS